MTAGLLLTASTSFYLPTEQHASNSIVFPARWSIRLPVIRRHFPQRIQRQFASVLRPRNSGTDTPPDEVHAVSSVVCNDDVVAASAQANGMLVLIGVAGTGDCQVAGDLAAVEPDSVRTVGAERQHHIYRFARGQAYPQVEHARLHILVLYALHVPRHDQGKVRRERRVPL